MRRDEKCLLRVIGHQLFNDASEIHRRSRDEVS
jgi:hypothetical protein